MKKPKPPLEKEVQREICDWLQMRGYFFWRSNNIPVFGMNNAGKRTFRSLPRHTPRGLPDIMIIENGNFIAIEVKREGAILRKEQVEFQFLCTAHGANYYVVHTLEELQRALVSPIKINYYGNGEAKI